MRLIKYLLLGIFFGIVLSKSEVISWFRIQEMFRFDSFHMYGIIGSAVVTGAILVFIAKKLQLRDAEGNPMVLAPKDNKFWRYIAGGTVFGLGWAMTGACPGPLYILVGNGIWVYIVAIAAAILGTFVYGLVREHLPH